MTKFNSKVFKIFVTERRSPFEERSNSLIIMTASVLLSRATSRVLLINSNFCSSIIRMKVDYSKVPKLNETELEEKFVRGSGPGGQSVNKTANNVILKHIPTGIIIKCHKTRSLEDNRKEARKILIAKLDNEINGDDSIEAQIKRIERKKSNENDRRRKKLYEMKQKWKERENIED